MKLDELQRKLIAAARADKPADRVPYAFEKRIMARLAARPVADVWAFWSRSLWRAAAPCVAITLVLGAWAWFGQNNSGSTTEEFSQDFEQTMLASVDQTEVASW